MSKAFRLRTYMVLVFDLSVNKEKKNNGRNFETSPWFYYLKVITLVGSSIKKL